MIKEPTLENLVKQTIPIHTIFNPHPTRERKEDCETERTYKKGLRVLMKAELRRIPCDRWDEDWDKVIEKYKQKVEQL